MTWIAAMPAAQASGLPPKVEVWMKGFPSSTPQMRGVETKAESGMTPPPSALPRHMMSGTTFQCSTPKTLPVRPMPVCTSSAISSAPYSSQALRTRGQKSSGGTMAPASPCTGSMITAATPLPVASALYSSSSTASASPNSTNCTPGKSGRKGSRYSHLPISESEPQLLPWKPRSEEMKLVRPVNRRASL